jgi:preprotein translocase subunit YajC
VGGAVPLIVLALVLGVLYVMMVRPQRRRQQELRHLVGSAGVGDDVLTNGGIYGTIVRAEGDDVEVEIAKGVTVHMTRQGITAVLPPEHETDEDAVTTDQEAVTSEVDEHDTAFDRR